MKKIDQTNYSLDRQTSKVNHVAFTGYFLSSTFNFRFFPRLFIIILFPFFIVNSRSMWVQTLNDINTLWMLVKVKTIAKKARMSMRMSMKNACIIILTTFCCLLAANQAIGKIVVDPGYAENPPNLISVKSADTTKGTVSIVKHNTETDNTAIISATSIGCYTFSAWSDGNTQNPRTVTVTSDTTFTAFFKDPPATFVDDVWYFGLPIGIGKSPGIRFVKDVNGDYIAQDASIESNVSARGNSLVVSSPHCEGQVIFYASNNQLYNSLHDIMDNGSYTGRHDISDGLAACYMGENKYLFFTVTSTYNNAKRLYAYVIDMNADNGRGARIGSPITVEAAHYRMSESIELIPHADSSNRYWLLYAHSNGSNAGAADEAGNYSNEIRVRLINVANPSSPLIGGIHSRITKTTSCTRTLSASQTYDKVAIVNSKTRSGRGVVDIFDFDNANGVLFNHRFINVFRPDCLFGLEFSPNGNQLYVSEYTTPAKVFQCNISGTTPALIDSVRYWSQTSSGSKGGGLKLGPDGKIYVLQAYAKQVGAISNPDSITPLGSRYDTAAVLLTKLGSITFDGIQFSEGLAKPSKVECDTMNNSPITQTDISSFCPSITSTNKVNVLLNDTDIDPNDKIYLTSAEFSNKADTNLATLTVNVVDSTITLTLKNNVNITTNHTFEIIYNIKDNGLPVSKCATGLLKITAQTQYILSTTKTELCKGLFSKLLSNTAGVWVSDNPNVASVSNDTAFGISDGIAKIKFTSSVTGCSEEIIITVKDFPVVPDEITGKKVVCIGDSIKLSHTTLGGVWMHNNKNVSLADPNANPVTVKGVTKGKSYITYTVSNGICKTKRMFQLKIISNTPPKIIIGVER